MRIGVKVTVTMKGSGFEMKARAALPAAADHAVGDIVNVAGVLYVLTAQRVWKRWLAGPSESRTDGAVAELARDAAGAALAAANADAGSDLSFAVDDAGDKITGTIKDRAIVPTMLDVPPRSQRGPELWAKQRAFLRAIGAEA